MSTFAAALSLVLALEGGYVNNPYDDGGPTNYGVTQAVYDRWRREHGYTQQPVTEITREEAEAIYYAYFWRGEPEQWDDLGHPGIALYVFDMRIQHRKWATIYQPVKRVLDLHPLLGLAELHAARTHYYASLDDWPHFGKGWMRRAATVYKEAMRLEHPDGELRVDLLNVNGAWWDVGIARMVGRKIYVRGSRRHGEGWLQRFWRRVNGVDTLEG